MPSGMEKFPLAARRVYVRGGGGEVVGGRQVDRDGAVVLRDEAVLEIVDEFGAASFEFSILGILDVPEPGDNIEHSLAALELHWLEKLQPFGGSGYNSAKAYQRDMDRLQNLSKKG